MRNDKINKILSSKAFYIAFSLLVSIALWMYVEISQNQDQTVRVEGVPIVFLNQDVLHDKNLVITSKSPETVTLTFDCKLAVVSKLKNTTLSVTVDLASINTALPTSLPFQIVLPPDVSQSQLTRTTRAVDRITLTVDKLYKKTVPVEGVYNGGTASSEYIAEAVQFDVDSITITGPETEVTKVSKAWVPIIRENLSASFTEELDFILLNDEGEEIDAEMYESLSFSQEKIRVTVPVKVKKEVSLTVELMAGAGAAAHNTKVTINPSIITVSGDPEVVRDFNSINLTTIDLTRIDIADSDMYPIVLPNNIVNQSGETEALVSVEILGLDTTHISVTNLHYVNLPAGYAATMITQSLDIKIRGTEAELALVTPSNIRVVADLANFSAGTSVVPAKVYIDGDVGDAGAIGEYSVTVTVSPVTG